MRSRGGAGIRFGLVYEKEKVVREKEGLACEEENVLMSEEREEGGGRGLLEIKCVVLDCFVWLVVSVVSVIL